MLVITNISNLPKISQAEISMMATPQSEEYFPPRYYTTSEPVSIAVPCNKYYLEHGSRVCVGRQSRSVSAWTIVRTQAQTKQLITQTSVYLSFFHCFLIERRDMGLTFNEHIQQSRPFETERIERGRNASTLDNQHYIFNLKHVYFRFRTLLHNVSICFNPFLPN